MADFNYGAPRKRGADWNYGGPKWKLSRSKLDFFLECPRCFYLDNKLGVKRPSFPPFNLNIAVDALLKKEFDMHRAQKTPHPLMDTYGVDAVPFQHEKLDEWRENFVGIQYAHALSGFTVSGAVDDIWQNPAGELMIVDYKATSKDGKIDELDDTKFHNQYRRQMEVYQWLFRKKGFKVSDTGYFVYVNGQKDRAAFDGKLEFDVTLIPYTGSDKWVEGAIMKAHACLNAGKIPERTKDCEYCCYVDFVCEEAEKFEGTSATQKKTAKTTTKKTATLKNKKADDTPSTLF